MRMRDITVVCNGHMPMSHPLVAYHQVAGVLLQFAAPGGFLTIRVRVRKLRPRWRLRDLGK
jgi:hypothetical protein